MAVLVNYKDGSQATMNEGNIFTYEPIRKINILKLALMIIK